jgi:hypothetical protein
MLSYLTFLGVDIIELRGVFIVRSKFEGKAEAWKLVSGGFGWMQACRSIRCLGHSEQGEVMTEAEIN